MTKRIFVDTSFFLAILNQRDKYHHVAKAVSADLNTPLVTSEAVLIELGDGLARLASRSLASRFLQTIKRDKNLIIVPLTTQLVDSAIELYCARPDKEWGLTDCISFVLMQQFGIREALTTDHHFEQAQFIRLIPHQH